MSKDKVSTKSDKKVASTHVRFRPFDAKCMSQAASGQMNNTELCHGRQKRWHRSSESQPEQEFMVNICYELDYFDYIKLK